MFGIKRGHWEPLLPPTWRTATMLMVPLTPIAVGADYLTGEPEWWWLSGLEQTMPLQWWGGLLISSGLMTIIGFVGRWRHVAIGGLHIGGALMVVLGIGIAVHSVTGVDGWRWPWLYLVVGAASWTAALGYWSQVEDDGSRCGPG